MAMRLHLHANFPYKMEIPNAALGYLKSALSEEKVAVTNIYWNLPPREIGESMLAFLSKFKEKRVDIFDPPTLLIVYLSRFFFTPHERIRVQPTLVETLFESRASSEELRKLAQALREYVDYSIENENMADVDVAGFTVNFYQWILNSYIWSRLKKLNPNITVVAGGLSTQDDAEAFMRKFPAVDFFVWGEGEIPLRELVRRIGDRQSLREVPHLVYRERGSLKSTDVRGDHPSKAPSFADHTEYFERLRQIGLTIFPRIPILSVWSCRWNQCKFCGVNKGAQYYEKPVDDTINEIEYQSEKYAIDRFIFLDTDFGRKNIKDFEGLLKGLLNSVDRRKSRYDIWATISPTLLTRKYVQMMIKIRIGVQIGFEAVTDTLLKKMNKMHRFAENIQALKFGKDYNLNISGLNIIRNLPEEREEDVLESMGNLDYLRFVLPHYDFTPSELTLYKGTEYYEMTPSHEREKRWVKNILYDKIQEIGLIKEEDRWDFFGFRARDLKHHFQWNQFLDRLKQVQQSEIFYFWTEFRDRSSLVEEYNHITKYKRYLLSDVETDILKFCDSIKQFKQLKEEFPSIPEHELEEAVSQLGSENLLYVDREKRHLISVLSANTIEKLDKG